MKTREGEQITLMGITECEQIWTKTEWDGDVKVGWGTSLKMVGAANEMEP